MRSGVSEILAPNNFGSALSKAALKGPLKGPFKGRNRAASAEQLEVMRSYNSQETPKFFCGGAKNSETSLLKPLSACELYPASQHLFSDCRGRGGEALPPKWGFCRCEATPAKVDLGV